MKLYKLCGLGAVLIAVTVGAPAGASALTLGSLPTADPGACAGSLPQSAFFTQTGTAPAAPSYTVPAGGGLITSWSTSFGPAGAPVELLLTSGGGSTFNVVGLDPETLPTPIPASNVSTFAVTHPLVVHGGEQLGLFYTGASDTRCDFTGSTSADQVAAGLTMTPPSVGGGLTASTTFGTALVNATATLLQSNDVAVTGAITPSAINTGGVANFAYQVTATPAGTGTLTDTLPVGLTAIAASTGTGSCSVAGQAITCPLPNLPATVNITVKGTAAGMYTNSVQVASSITDTNPANNTVSTALAVVAPPPTPQCTVPKLKGAPLSVAKGVLPLVNCKVGKVSKASSKSVAKGDVISTNPGGGKKLAAGSKVAIKQSSGKPKKKTHKKK